MSSENAYLSLRLEGPLQSWGYESQYNRRTTGLMPTKSGVAGICCAALGFGRGSSEEATFLRAFVKLKMTAIAVPQEKSVQRMTDYHTVQNTRTAEGKNKDCHITYRQYLNDSRFGIVISGSSAILSTIADALQNPVWGVYLGRKCCIPSAPLYAGVHDTEEAAVHSLIGTRLLIECRVQRDVERFEDGRDSLPDLLVSFDSAGRMFTPRRICLQESVK